MGSAGETGRLRALLLIKCGMVDSREGSFPTARPQLLVYGTDGRLEVIADVSTAATLDWKTDGDAPKLGRAFVAGLRGADDLEIESAVAVATK